MNTTPFVTIVMPAFDCARYIAAAIESVLAQSYTHWELVIVNDGSTDDTGAIAEDFAKREPGRIKVLHQSNAGIAQARNRALAEASPASELMAFLDSDDVWLSGALTKMVLGLRDRPEWVGVHGLRTYIDKEGVPLVINGASHAPLRRRAVQRNRLRTVSVSEPTTYEVLAYGCCVFTGALLVRTDAVRAVGLFDPKAVPAEDWDMWLRLSLRAPFGFIREPLYGYRLHGTNSTRDSIRKNDALYYVRRKFATDPCFPRPTRATMVAGFRWYEVYRATVCFRELGRRVHAGPVREAATVGWRGLRHLWTSVRPGQGSLAALGAQSNRPVRG